MKLVFLNVACPLMCLVVGIVCRMQVEVSKHTEGKKEKVLRPNGLPESLIRYDGQFQMLNWFHVAYQKFDL